MTEKRYYQKDWEELYYVFDSKTISENEFEERVEYDGYDVFADSLTSKEVVVLLNELHEENQIKLEIIDSFIRGLEDEKGIDPENVEFQCRMNFTIKVLKKLKKDMLEPTEFKRLKELIE